MDAPIVCMISCLHPLYDDRIYWKEALSLKKHGYNVIHLGVDDTDYDIISEHGIRLISVKRKRYFGNPYVDKLFRIIAFRRNIYRDLYSKARQLRADIYHLHDLQLNRISLKIKKMRHAPKLIYDVHEPYPEIQKYLSREKAFRNVINNVLAYRIHFIQKRNAQYFDRIITTEQNVLDYFKKFYPHEKLLALYNYPFIPKLSNQKSNKEFDIIYVGGISTWRGVNILLDIAQMAKQRSNSLKILCLGQVKEYNLKKEIENTIRRFKLQDHFILENFVPFNKVPEYLSKSKLGFCIFQDNPVYHIIMPIKLFEYMSFGLPVICNDFGHAKNIIANENCGIPIVDIDAENIYNTIEDLLNSPDKYKHLSNNGISATRSKYNWKVSESILIGLYQKIISTENALK